MGSGRATLPLVEDFVGMARQSYTSLRITLKHAMRAMGEVDTGVS
jgi:hypothetical protein